ncbi:MAG: 2-oxo acid dehydrogenase subunit E2 [Acidimicrobiia bacterium]|nr:2-oxo acid dehydrogenase subunit E2 [Acidimicrobiia bacterium]
MSLTVTMPQLGETVTEGTILRWAKKAGDTIREDETLLEISTDKVDTEVPSPIAGTILQILVAEGATVSVGTPLVIIGQAGEAAASPAAMSAAPPAPVAAPVAPVAPTVSATPPVAAPPVAAPVAAPPATVSMPQPQVMNVTVTRDPGMLSPVVRRLAAEHGIDLSRVIGTGIDGRITRRDVEAHVALAAAVPRSQPEPSRTVLGRGIQDLISEEPAPADHVLFTPAAPVAAATVPPVPVAPVPATTTTPSPATVAPATAPVPVFSAEGSVEDLSRLRMRIAENMIRAKQTAAHVWTSVEVDFEHVERIRSRHREGFKAREGFSLTYLPFISRATVDALNTFPVVNSSLDLPNRVRIMHGGVNLGIAIDLNEDGLVVMTLRGADGLRLRGIAREARRLADKARTGKIEPDDLAGSTFTITNPGPFGSFMSAPIINVPNVAILSTDTVVKRPVVVTDKDGNDAIAIHHIGYLGLSWDHRAFDGSTAVMFLSRIKQNLETWDWEQELA